MNGDIRLKWDTLHASLILTESGDDFDTDAGLETAVIISLFTDKRAGEHDELPATEEDRRGWWGNSLQDPDDEIGSKLWLLRREKQLPEVFRRAEEYALDALRWLIRDKVSSRVEVKASNPRTGWLLLDIWIYRPTGDKLNFKYDYNWQSQEYKNAVSASNAPAT